RDGRIQRKMRPFFPSSNKNLKSGSSLVKIMSLLWHNIINSDFERISAKKFVTLRRLRHRNKGWFYNDYSLPLCHEVQMDDCYCFIFYVYRTHRRTDPAAIYSAGHRQRNYD